MTPDPITIDMLPLFTCMCLALAALFILRDELIRRIRRERFAEIASANRDDLQVLKLDEQRARWKRYEAVTYDAMFWDLSRWSYEQFYPEAA